MRKAFELLNVKAGMRILDAGCGTGKWSVELAKKGAIVIGIDLSKEMIKLAKERAQKIKIHNISFLNQKIGDLDYWNYFDAVISIVVLQHITDEQSLSLAVEKIIGATKKGGRILTIDTAPAKREEKIISERDVEHMKPRTKKEWIALFESRGAIFIKSREASLMAGHFIAARFKKQTIKKLVEKLCELVDMHMAGWKMFRNYTKSTIFLFQKKF